MRCVRTLIAAAALGLVAAGAQAQSYPTKPVHIVIPYSPGGSTDISARVLAAKLTDMWGQQVVVDNRPGGNGFIGMAAGAKAAPDGYTLTLATVGDAAVNPSLFKNVPFEMDRDFVPISMVSDADLVLVVNKDAPYKSVADVLAAAKAQPGRISVATSGTGTMPHIVLEWMALNTGTQFQHVPYKGGGPGAAAVAAGDVPVGILSASGVTSFVKSGHIRILAVCGAKRSKFDPSVPTLQESGVKDVNGSGWAALFAPKGVPGAILTELNAAVVKALGAPDVVERYAGAGMIAVSSSSAELEARVKSDGERFKSIITAAHIQTQ